MLCARIQRAAICLSLIGCFGSPSTADAAESGASPTRGQAVTASGSASPEGHRSSVDGAPTRAGAWLLAGLGVGAIGTGTAFGILALDQRGIREDHCSESQRICDSEGIAATQLGRRYALWSTLALGAGAISTAGSVFLFQRSARLQASVGPGSVALSFSKHW